MPKDELIHLLDLIENETVECDKSVYITDSVNMDAELEYYRKNYYWIKFVAGRDTIDETMIAYTFNQVGVSKVPMYFKNIFESGIDSVLDAEYRGRPYSERERRISVEKKIRNTSMTLDGGIITLFIVCGSIIGLAVGRFATEIRATLWTISWKFYKEIRNFARYIKNRFRRKGSMKTVWRKIRLT